MNTAKRNQYAAKLSALRERMGQPGYTVLTTDRELLAELVVMLEVRSRYKLKEVEA